MRNQKHQIPYPGTEGRNVPFATLPHGIHHFPTVTHGHTVTRSHSHTQSHSHTVTHGHTVTQSHTVTDSHTHSHTVKLAITTAKQSLPHLAQLCWGMALKARQGQSQGKGKGQDTGTGRASRQRLSGQGMAGRATLQAAQLGLFQGQHG